MRLLKFIACVLIGFFLLGVLILFIVFIECSIKIHPQITIICLLSLISLGLGTMIYVIIEN